MPLRISPYAIATPYLFGDAGPQAREAPAIAHPVQALAEQALGRNHEAIEMLLNLTIAAKDPAVRREAARTVLDLYRTPATPEDVRQSIGQQALALAEASGPAASTYAALGRRTPVSLLYLAGLHAHRAGSASEKTIEASLRATLGGHGSVLALEPEEVLLSFGRPVGDSEVTLAAAGLAHLQRHGASVTPSDAGFSANLAGAAGQADGPFAVIVNLPGKAGTGGLSKHWGLLLIHPRHERERKVFDCLFWDSNDAPDASSPAHQAIVRALEADFGEQLRPIRWGGGWLQGVVPDGCGPLDVLAMRQLDATLARQPNAGFATLCQSLASFTSEWIDLTVPQKQALVAGERAAMLERVAEANARMRPVS